MKAGRIHKESYSAGHTRAFATISRDLQSLEFEAAMEARKG